MKILIETPSWLGDAVMTSPAIENLVNHFTDVEITLIGSAISISTLKNHPNVVKTHVVDKNLNNLFKTLINIGEFDIFLSFRSSLRAKLIKLFISSEKKYQFNKKKYKNLHQVEKYNSFFNDSLNIKSTPDKLVVHTNNFTKNHQSKLLGINPGASYGSSKRWSPREFGAVATHMSNKYDIVIFGGTKEKNIAADIERYLINNGVENYENLAGKTSISSLISKIQTLDLFITGDSGPMHLASAFQVPTVTIFGPTNDTETSQWKNEKSFIVKKDLECQPCMKRTCPLKHHNCMRLIKSKDVLSIIETIN
jgi:heptosyltransferase II